jgi:Tol biopolymer transport system component
MLAPWRRRSQARLCCAVLGLALLVSCGESGGEHPHGIEGPPSGGLVFIREVDGRTDLARARLADGAVALVSRTPAREERWPYWSGVTRRVVFPARPYGSKPEANLILWDPESGEERVLTPTPHRDERWPTWSPVEPKLAFAFKQRRRPSGIGILDLVAERSETVASTAFPGVFLRPAFSPDGRLLVAQRRMGRSSDTELWLVQPGRPARRLTREPGAIDTKARFTNDGRSILFTRRFEGEVPTNLFLLDLESNSTRLFASLPTANDHSAWPSPTRGEVAFVSDREGSRDVFLVDLASGAPRNLTRTPDTDEMAPVWSPDGELLVILRTRAAARGERPGSGERILAVIDREGRALFETPGMMADWMPAWP